MLKDLAPAFSSPAPLQRAPERRDLVGKGQRTILVVDDDADVRDLAVEILTALGYRVLAAASGAGALSILREDPAIALLFTDLVMPGGLDGTQLAERALAFRPDLKVLFTSAYTLHPSVGALPVGRAFIAKPYRQRDLAASIKGLIGA